MNKMIEHEEEFLTKNYRRRLISTLYVIEKRLDELRVMALMDSKPVMYVIENNPCPEERNVILNEISVIKKQIAELKKKYHLEPRIDSFTQTANTYISSSIIDLTEILSKRMKGYGKFLNEKDAEEYDEDVKFLTSFLRNFPLK